MVLLNVENFIACYSWWPWKGTKGSLLAEKVQVDDHYKALSVGSNCMLNPVNSYILEHIYRALFVS